MPEIPSVLPYDRDSPEWVQYAVREVWEKDTVAVTAAGNPTSAHKFGQNSSVGTTTATVMGLGGSEVHETYVSTNAITSVSSSSGSDTTQTLTVVGHTVSAGAFTRVTQTVDLTGQTDVVLATALARAERAYVSTGATDLVGTIYVHEGGDTTSGVPDTDTEAHLTIPAGENQSFKCALTTSDNEYLFISEMSAAVLRAQSTQVDIKLQVRSPGGVFRSQYSFGVGSTGSSAVTVPFVPFLIIAPNSDVRVVATSSAVSTDVTAEMDGVYATVIR